MKKLILGTALLAVLAGCTTSPTTTQKPNAKPVPHHPSYNPDAPYHKDAHHHKGMKKGEHPAVYECDKNTQIAAKYNADTQIAKLYITAPALGLNGQEVELKQAVSASGSRYVNDKNPASVYEWHTKGANGMLNIVAGKKQYSYTCNEVYPNKHKR